MPDRKPDIIRASSLADFADCARRGASRIFRREIEAAGSEEDTMPDLVSESFQLKYTDDDKEIHELHISVRVGHTDYKDDPAVWNKPITLILLTTDSSKSEYEQIFDLSVMEAKILSKILRGMAKAAERVESNA